MRIGELAKAAGVGVETVRFYERKGLIKQPLKPSTGGYRSYCEETLYKIRFIKRAQDLGFSLREVEQLLSLQADPSSDCSDVRRQAEQKLREINDKICQLKSIGKALERVISACPGSGSIRKCSILDELGEMKNV